MPRLPGAFQTDLKQSQNAALGRLILRWGQIDHVVANCILELSGRRRGRKRDKIDVLTAGQKIPILEGLRNTPRMSVEAVLAFDAFMPLWKGLIGVRNHVAHGVVAWDPDGRATTKLLYRERAVAIKDILAAEAITNFAAHAVLALRLAIGVSDDPEARHRLPPRPALPAIVRSYMKDAVSEY